MNKKKQELEKLILIRDFIDFVKNPPKDDKLEILENYLIQIYLYCFNIQYRQGKLPIRIADYDEWRKIVSNNFSELGLYNDVLEIKDNLGETEFATGDAVDDLTDIVIDVSNALTLKKEKDILSSLKMDFEFHTKNHIINLLRYLNSEI